MGCEGAAPSWRATGLPNTFVRPGSLQHLDPRPVTEPLPELRHGRRSAEERGRGLAGRDPGPRWRRQPDAAGVERVDAVPEPGSGCGKGGAQRASECGRSDGVDARRSDARDLDRALDSDSKRSARQGQDERVRARHVARDARAAAFCNGGQRHVPRVREQHRRAGVRRDEGGRRAGRPAGPRRARHSPGRSGRSSPPRSRSSA